MLKSTRTWLAVLAVVLICLAVLVIPSTKAAACLPYGTYRYYTNAAHTTLVGTLNVFCDCHATMTGTKTSFVVFTARTCGIEP
jgi:uncharacterized membrane protein